jgi:hypothetical protein
MSEWIFYKNLDYIGGDISYFKTDNLDLLFKHANEINNCVGFNTLGFFKSEINMKNLVKSPYFRENDGIFIKKIIDKKCYICGCVKNNGKYLDMVFKNIKTIISNFSEYKIIMAYDKSNDNSLDILKKYEQELNLKIIYCNNTENYVCKNICSARNQILDTIIDENLNYDYMIMIDMDDVCSNSININNFQIALKQDDWDMISFNRIDYYDIWALSLDNYFISCQHWENNWFEVAYKMKNYVSEKLSNIRDNIEVYSAFNGFGIYKLDKFKDCRYSTDFYKNLSFFDEREILKNKISVEKNIRYDLSVDCEHRHFHLQAIKLNNAKIKISPLNLFDKIQ